MKEKNYLVNRPTDKEVDDIYLYKFNHWKNLGINDNVICTLKYALFNLVWFGKYSLEISKQMTKINPTYKEINDIYNNFQNRIRTNIQAILPYTKCIHANDDNGMIEIDMPSTMSITIKETKDYLEERKVNKVAIDTIISDLKNHFEVKNLVPDKNYIMKKSINRLIKLVKEDLKN